VPGDYEVAAAVYDSLSKEHSLKRTKLRVPQVWRDPLRSVWRDLPTVALGGRACFQPPLPLVLNTSEPARIDVMVNRPVKPSSIPARLRLISEMEILNGSIAVTLLDLQDRKVKTLTAAHTQDESALWPRSPQNRYIADVHAIENDPQSELFFVSEVRKRLESLQSAEGEHALVILSEPRKFPKDANVQPIELKRPPATRVLYVRCLGPHTYVSTPDVIPSILVTPSSIPSVPSGPIVYDNTNYSDSLERTLASLHPRLFDVATPEQFRHALAEIMSEIAQQK
jgi:hypothetical protein